MLSAERFQSCGAGGVRREPEWETPVVFGEAALLCKLSNTNGGQGRETALASWS